MKISTQVINRHTPLTLTKVKSLKNRIVVPAMASGTATTDGFVTEKTIAHYERLVKSGAGLIIGEYTYISPEGRSEENQLGAHSADHVPGLKSLAAMLKQKGALAGLQLTHAGGKSSTDLTGGKLWAPSSIPTPVKGKILETPLEMSVLKISELKNLFLEAAHRAFQAGFDLIELHSAHGYGLNQWLSPLTNQRTDEYGGSLEGRTRLLLEIVQEINLQLPQLLISVRIPGQDFIPGGWSIDDSILLTKKLKSVGTSIVNVSSGIGGWQRPEPRQGEGYLVPEAKAIQKEVDIPIIAVGGIKTADYIDNGLTQKWFSLAAVGRAILEDPEGWQNYYL